MKQAVSKEEFARRIQEQTLPEILNRVEVTAGELYFIPSGTLHAIGAGILLAEIQQNSNTTYRVYDYGRRGADGRLRPLHIEKALDVANLNPLAPTVQYAPAPVSGGSVRKLERVGILPRMRSRYTVRFALPWERSRSTTCCSCPALPC